MVFVGQLMVALCFAELAANFPVPGSIYNWAKRLGTATVAWLGGWMMLTASIVTIAAVALAYQITLPQIWSARSSSTATAPASTTSPPTR